MIYMPNCEESARALDQMDISQVQGAGLAVEKLTLKTSRLGPPIVSCSVFGSKVVEFERQPKQYLISSTNDGLKVHLLGSLPTSQGSFNLSLLGYRFLSDSSSRSLPRLLSPSSWRSNITLTLCKRYFPGPYHTYSRDVLPVVFQ